METKVQTAWVDPRKAVQAAVGVISANQSETPAIQSAAVFIAFAAMCERLGINHFEAYYRGLRIMRDGDICREASALRDYIDNEVRNRGRF